MVGQHPGRRGPVTSITGSGNATPSEAGGGFTGDETEIGGADAVPEKTTGSETRDGAEFPGA